MPKLWKPSTMSIVDSELEVDDDDDDWFVDPRFASASGNILMMSMPIKLSPRQKIRKPIVFEPVLMTPSKMRPSSVEITTTSERKFSQDKRPSSISLSPKAKEKESYAEMRRPRVKKDHTKRDATMFNLGGSGRSIDDGRGGTHGQPSSGEEGIKVRKESGGKKRRGVHWRSVEIVSIPEFYTDETWGEGHEVERIDIAEEGVAETDAAVEAEEEVEVVAVLEEEVRGTEDLKERVAEEGTSEGEAVVEEQKEEPIEEKEQPREKEPDEEIINVDRRTLVVPSAFEEVVPLLESESVLDEIALPITLSKQRRTPSVQSTITLDNFPIIKSRKSTMSIKSNVSHISSTWKTSHMSLTPKRSARSKMKIRRRRNRRMMHSDSTGSSSSSESADGIIITFESMFAARAKEMMRISGQSSRDDVLLHEEQTLSTTIVDEEKVKTKDVKKKKKKKKKKKVDNYFKYWYKRPPPKKMGWIVWKKKLEEEEKRIRAERLARIKKLHAQKQWLREVAAMTAKEEKELHDHAYHVRQFDNIYDIMAACDEATLVKTQQEQEDEEWRQYLVCDGLPAPWDVPGMNTYLHLWEKEIPTVTVDQSVKRTNQAINLLDKLENILDDPFDLRDWKLQDWKWVASLFRKHQSENLEYCTYRLLRDIKSRLNRITIPTADFKVKDELFSMCLYVAITLPKPTYNPRAPQRGRVALNWAEMQVEVVFPQSLKCDMLAIRGMYLKYDHWSDTCSTYKCDNLPKYYSKTLSEACHDILGCKQLYKYDNRKTSLEPVSHSRLSSRASRTSPINRPIDSDEEIPLTSPQTDNFDFAPRTKYQRLDPMPSDYCMEQLRNEMKEALDSLALKDLPSGILNLRKYVVLGGIYFLDLFYQPPQPQSMVSFDITISTLLEPYRLQPATFFVNYQAPPAHQPGTRRTPEEIEAEMMQQEKELDELIALTLVLPKHVYWLEPPIVAQWSYQHNSWQTNHIFDFKNIEEKGYVTFRTGMFRPMAIATLRWSNLPFQAWEIRPGKDASVTFQLTCAILTIEFHVKDNKICVKDVQCAPNDAFNKHIGVYYHFSLLRKIMKSIGIDVFPFFDTFNYVEGTCEKYWPMENHLYFCLAYLSVVYNFTWSRWNMTVDVRTIVFQMRNYRFDCAKQPNFDTVLVQPTRTIYIECTEVSQEFSETPVQGMKNFVDLWHLIRSTSTKVFKTRIQNADLTMVKTLYRLYKNIRFLSFS